MSGSWKQDNGTDHPDTAELEQLRRIILGVERDRLENLSGRFDGALKKLGEIENETSRLASQLDEPDKRSELIGEVLSSAVRSHSSEQRAEFSRNLTPTVEGSILESVQQNPDFLSSALYPVMVPAIKRAIASALDHIVQRVNRTIEHRFSIQSVRWRIEAARSGVDYGEYLLTKTLEYRVDETFLIHQPTGILLLHESIESQTEDADLISGMLTAIQDFVHDSFKVDDEEALDSMEVGGLKVWIERSDHSALAAVIRGTPPSDLRDTLSEASEAIHARHYSDFVSFEGETSAFEPSRPLLTRLLRSEFSKSQETEDADEIGRKRLLGWLGPGLILAVVLIFAFFYFRTSIRWSDYLDSLRQEPGIVVVESSRLEVRGLLDPLATDPAGLLDNAKLNAEDVVASWEPYRSLATPIQVRRALDAIDVPESTSTSVSGSVIVLEGTADESWIWHAQSIVSTYLGLSLDLSLVVPILDEPGRSLNNGILADSYQFVDGVAAVTPVSERRLATFVDAIHSLSASYDALGYDLVLEVTGHASALGDAEENQRLSERRADVFRNLLFTSGLDSTRVRVTTAGAGSSHVINTGNPAEDQRNSRRVTFLTSVTYRKL